MSTKHFQLFGLLLFLTFTSGALAHPMPSSVLLLDVHEQTVGAELQIPLSELGLALKEDLMGEPDTVLASYGAQLRDYLKQHIQPVTSEGQAWTVQVDNLTVKTVNARTLATDSEFRDRALKNRILYTDDYEFVTFAPTKLTGLPDAATFGEPFDFQMTDELTIMDVTRPVTFDVTVTPTEDGLEGLATTTFPYEDFSLNIPASQAVQAVADEVTLEFNFTAAEDA